MNPVADPEWAGLAARWQAEVLPPRLSVERLLRREGRRRLLMGLLVAVEALLSLTAVAATVSARRRLPEPNGTLLLIAALVYVVLVWGFALWNRRGTWRPLARTTEAFVAVSKLRCRRGLRSVRFVVTVVTTQLLLTAGWLVLRAGGETPVWTARETLALAPSLSVGVLFLLWAVWYRRVMLRRLAWLEQMPS
ncbi:MAG TPA: hypothetical protein VGA78_14460 [Gemmatimonadales bacterium]|jgi:hypothetical protein